MLVTAHAAIEQKDTESICRVKMIKKKNHNKYYNTIRIKNYPNKSNKVNEDLQTTVGPFFV